jgi:hypothetical protein
MTVHEQIIAVRTLQYNRAHVRPGATVRAHIALSDLTDIFVPAFPAFDLLGAHPVIAADAYRYMEAPAAVRAGTGAPSSFPALVHERQVLLAFIEMAVTGRRVSVTVRALEMMNANRALRVEQGRIEVYQGRITLRTLRRLHWRGRGRIILIIYRFFPLDHV